MVLILAFLTRCGLLFGIVQPVVCISYGHKL